MWPFKSKPTIGLIHLEPTNSFEGCPHVLTVHQYGSHPSRVYVACARCLKFAILEWRDPKARWFNRIFYSIPLVWQAMLAFIAIAFVLFVLIPALIRP